MNKKNIFSMILIFLCISNTNVNYGLSDQNNSITLKEEFEVSVPSYIYLPEKDLSIIPLPHIIITLNWDHYYEINATEYRVYRFNQKMNDSIDVENTKARYITTNKNITERIFIPGIYYYYVITKTEEGYDNKIYNLYNERIVEITLSYEYITFTILLSLVFVISYYVIIKPALKCRKGGEGSYFCPSKIEKKKEEEYIEKKKKNVRLA